MIKICCTLFLLIPFTLLPQKQIAGASTVLKPISFDVSLPLKEIPGIPSKVRTNFKDNIVPNQKYKLPRRFDYDTSNFKDPALQTSGGFKAAGDILLNYDGLGNRNFVYPPDVSIDVGPNHQVQLVNSSVQMWNKTGTSIYGPFDISTIWSGFPGPWSTSLNDGDPVVLYDETANRWLLSEFSLPNFPNGPFYMLIAISTTSDPTGSYYRYGYQFTNLCDYPKIGVWRDAYYMSCNMFAPNGSGNWTYAGVTLSAMDRTKMLNGDAGATIQNFALNTNYWSFLPADCDGTFPPEGTPGYFLSTGWGYFEIAELKINWSTPASSTCTFPYTLTPTAFNELFTLIPQSGTAVGLDALSDRLMQRLQYRNFGDHQSMVVCQTVNVGSNRAGMRWYHLQKTTGNWSIYQQSTYAPVDGLHRWMGSIAMDINENIALGYSVSSSSMFPSIRFTGRLRTDALNTMSFSEKTIISGLGYQSGSAGRWGDYTTMSVDPSDGETFWYANQYLLTSAAANWKTRIATFEFNSALPVEISAFNYSIKNKAVNLNWETSSESMNHGFDIERSSENTKWQKIGFVKGNGTSNNVHNYSWSDKNLKSNGKYFYRLKQIDVDGAFKYLNEAEVNVNFVADDFILEQNYPNPFNPTTIIRYAVPENTAVRIAIFNALGEKVDELFNGYAEAGVHELNYNSGKLSAGMYYYRLETAATSLSRKMIVLK